MDLTSILGTIFSGGVTGIIGSISSAIANYKLKKLEYQHRERMEEISIQQMKLETERDIKISELEIERETREAISQERMESYKTDRATYISPDTLEKLGFFGKIISFLLGLVDFARGMIRPGSTAFFEIYMFFVWWTLYNMIKGFESLPKEKIIDLFYMVTMLLLYVGSTTVSWWFGSRGVEKFFNWRK